jgi:hypothetical protein
LTSSPTTGSPCSSKRDAIDEAAPRVENLLHVPLGRHLAAHGQEIHHHVRACLAEYARDVHGGAGGLGDDLGEVVAEAVVGHAALDGHAQVGYLAEAHGVVGLGPDRLGQIEPDLVGIDVEGRRELDVTYVVPGQAGTHETRNEAVVRGLLVVVNSLNECRGAIADSDDGDAYGSHVYLQMVGLKTAQLTIAPALP